MTTPTKRRFLRPRVVIPAILVLIIALILAAALALRPYNGKWGYGKRRQFVIKSARATKKTELAILGHNGRVLEYNPKADPTPRFEQKEDGLHIDVMRAQRLYNDKTWPNPIVARITNVEAVKTK